MTSPSGLQLLWFGLIIVLWVGYFLLEGFDFGVVILSPFIGRDDVERRMVLGTIGPVWDGNEVWLLTAGGATFAAFPLWYATLFSGFYLALFLILVALIVRGVGFEFRHQREDARWRTMWDWLLFAGSLVPALLWGVAFADILQGVPINAHHIYTGTLLDLLNVYSLLGGVTSAGLFTLYGAIFLSLKLTGPPAERAHAVAQRAGAPGDGGRVRLSRVHPRQRDQRDQHRRRAGAAAHPRGGPRRAHARSSSATASTDGRSRSSAARSHWWCSRCSSTSTRVSSCPAPAAPSA